MLYTAFMADIVNSKKLITEDRGQVQLFIKQCLQTLNNIFRPSLVFDVIFSAGDEVQGLFKTPNAALMYFRLFKMILSPLQIRCGIGVGEWDVKILHGTSSEQDGPAYHNARNAILKVHNINGCNVLFNSNSENDIYINTLLNSSFLLTQKQSKYQNQIYLLTELMVPFYDEYVMDLHYLVEIFTLIRDNKYLEFYSLTKNRQDNIITQFYEISTTSDPVYIFSKPIFENKIILESTLKKGLSTRISNITNTSRQNIDNVLKSANISAIRNIDLTTLIFIHKNFEVNLWN